MLGETSPVVICVFGVSAKIGIGVEVMVIGSSISAPGSGSMPTSSSD